VRRETGYAGGLNGKEVIHPNQKVPKESQSSRRKQLVAICCPRPLCSLPSNFPQQHTTSIRRRRRRLPLSPSIRQMLPKSMMNLLEKRRKNQQVLVSSFLFIHNFHLFSFLTLQIWKDYNKFRRERE